MTTIPDHVLVVTPAHGIKVGETYPNDATAQWEVPDVFDVRLLSVWRSSNPAVATINAAGEATGVSSGMTEISATYNGITGSRTLIVHAQ